MRAAIWPRTRSGSAAVILLCVLFAVNLYRAAHQSITIDEAYTYHKHIAAWKFWTFWEYTANNHVLNTVLGKFFIWLFGLSEFALRLPSLLGGLLYFVVIFRISRLLFGDSSWFLLSITLNCLNPLILDFLSAARGYGMGLAFFSLGLFYCLEYPTPDASVEPNSRRAQAIKAGGALGLAVVAQLTYAVPTVALVSVLIAVMLSRAARKGHDGAWTDVLRFPALLILTGIAIAVALLAWPMRNARPGNFYVGDPEFRDTVWSLVYGSLSYKATVLDTVPFLHRVLFDRMPDLLILLFGGTLVVVAIGMIRRRKPTTEVRLFRERLLLILGVMLTCWLLLATARMFVARPFPDGRTALYFLPLAWWACLLALQSVGNNVLKFAGVLTTLILVFQFGLEFNLSYYWVYPHDAAVKSMASLIRNRRARDTGEEIKIGATWYLADSINFYRAMYRTNWIPVTRDGPDCYYDYYLLAPEDKPIVSRYHLAELYRDDLSGVVLAKPGDAALRALETIYPPPIQHSPPCGVDPEKLGPAVRLGDPDAGPHIVRDLQKGCRTPWTYERPMLLFRVDRRKDARFVMHFLIPEVVFSQTGPLTLSIWINNRRLDQRVYRNSGDQTFEQSIPAGFLEPYRLTAVEFRLDKYYVDPKDGVKMGFLLVDAAFTSAPSD